MTIPLHTHTHTHTHAILILFKCMSVWRDAAPLFRVGQNRIYTPYMTVYLVISLPKIPYIHRIYMVFANPTNEVELATKENKAATNKVTNDGHLHLHLQSHILATQRVPDG